jgi:hypothetical protein
MANAAPEAPEAKTDAKPRPETTFVVLVRAKGETPWNLIQERVTAKTQDDAKKQAARLLGEQEQYRALIEGEGLEIAVTSARSFKPVLVKVEPQPAKVVISS